MPFDAPSMTAMRRLLALPAAVCCTLLCGPAWSGSLTLALPPAPLVLPLRVAQVEGLFAAEGMQVHVIGCPSGARCLRAMLDGQADVA